MKYLVTGAGGFIGHHLVKRLKSQGHFVRGVDIKTPEFEKSPADQFFTLDLRYSYNARIACQGGIERVYALAADMGGMGYIANNHQEILHNNLLINLYTLKAADRAGVKRYLFSSSACVYPEYLQESTDVAPLKESDAYPADPQDAYGWEKLTTEKMLEYYEGDMKLYMARFHNIYGPLGTWEGGREKVPAAFCRKAAVVATTGNPAFEIWGDGQQTRSFCYIDDLLDGIQLLMESDYHKPINIGRDRMVSINELAYIVADIAGVKIEPYHVDGPEGVRGRNSDNSLLKEVLGWEPTTPIEEGLKPTYKWIKEQYNDSLDDNDLGRWLGRLRKAGNRLRKKA